MAPGIGMTLGLQRRVLAALAILAAGAALGIGAASTSNVSASTALLAVPALLVFGFVVSQGPDWCLLGLIASVVLGFSNDSAAVGSVDLRISDLFLVALAIWVVVLRERTGQRGWIPGRRVLAVWLVVLGVSLYPLLVHGTTDVGSLLGWLRLVATFALAWFVPYTLYRQRDLDRLFAGIAVIMTAELVVAVADAVASGRTGARLSGANGPNATGLIAAVVIVLALHGPVPARRSLKLLMLAIGLVGLLMSRSLGSTTAVVVAVGIYGIQNVRSRRPDSPHRELVVPTRLLAMVVVGLGIAMALRPGNLPTSPEFGSSTTVHRAVLADAGLEVFAAHPILGAGWQQAPREIGSPEVAKALQERFGGRVNPAFIPREGPNSEVHNAYVQVLAEAGLVGFVLLIAVIITLGRGIALILRSVRTDPRLYVAARAAAVLLVVLLVWWNDNTLYGAQTESILAATCLGILAAIPAIARTERAQRTIATPISS